MRLMVIIMTTLASLWAQTGVTQELLKKYEAEGAGPFDAKRGEAMWSKDYVNKDGEKLSCVSCHNKDLTKKGKHYKSGKVIEPMAPSVNKERFTDIKHTKKWFKRNCKSVYDRECTPQEKGDFILYILTK